jgi:hypothetical protein
VQHVSLAIPNSHLAPAILPDAPDRSPLAVRIALAIHRNTWVALDMTTAFLHATDQSERLQWVWPPEDAEDEAFDEITRLSCGSREGAAAMLAHLEWYLEAHPSHPKQPVLSPAEATLVRVRMADMRLLLGHAAPTSPAPILSGIEVHRAAWLAFVAVPGRDVIGREAWRALDVASDAAADAVLEMPCGDKQGAAALVAHTRWYAEELAKADDSLTDGLGYALRPLQARQVDLSLLAIT